MSRATAPPTSARGAPATDPGRLGPSGRQWLLALGLVAATRATLFAVAAAGDLLLRGGAPTGLDVWRRWDADIYLTIAEHGWSGPAAEPFSEAFLPAFPLLVRLVAATGIPLIVAGLVVSAAAAVVAVAYLLRLADADEGAGAGRRAALYLLLFPTAVFLVAPYTESLFLAGAIPAFHYARRGAWGGVVAPAAVAAGTRLTGVLLLAGLAVEAWRRGETIRAVAPLVVAAVPLLAYLAWLWATRGTPLYVLTAQEAGWQRQLVGPLSALQTTLGAWDDASGWRWLTWRLEVVAAVIGLMIVGVAARRREWGYVAYVGGTWAVLLSSTWYYSLPRMLLGAFPLVVFLAAWSGRAPLRHDLLLGGFAATAALGTLAFTAGAWFF